MDPNRKLHYLVTLLRPVKIDGVDDLTKFGFSSANINYKKLLEKLSSEVTSGGGISTLRGLGRELYGEFYPANGSFGVFKPDLSKIIPDMTKKHKKKYVCYMESKPEGYFSDNLCHFSGSPEDLMEVLPPVVQGAKKFGGGDSITDLDTILKVMQNYEYSKKNGENMPNFA